MGPLVYLGRVYLGRDLQDRGPLLSQRVRMLCDSVGYYSWMLWQVLAVSLNPCLLVSREDGTGPLVKIRCLNRRVWLQYGLEASRRAVDPILLFQCKER